MRILYIASSFPEPSKGDTIYTDLAEALSEAGNVLTVVVSEETKNKTNPDMGIERGFEVLRIKTGNYYDVGLLEKGITTIKIPILMKKGISRHLGKRGYDLILFEAPPVTIASLIDWTKHKFNCPAYLMLKDIFPQNAVDLGIMKKNGLLYRYFQLKEKKLYRTADIIGCMSNANKEYIMEHNTWLNKDKVEIFPNTKKMTEDYSNNGNPMRDLYNIPHDACLFLYGGNMGKPQYIELLSRVVIEFQNDKKAFFLFVGRGTERYKLEDTIKEHNISNAHVLQNMHRRDYDQLIRESDIGMIVLDPRFTIPNYPSRILSYMEYAKPLLAATDRTSDINKLIEDGNCGAWVWSGDDQKVFETIRTMMKRTDLTELGENGRDFMKNNFTIEHSVKILKSALSNISDVRMAQP